MIQQVTMPSFLGSLPAATKPEQKPKGNRVETTRMRIDSVFAIIKASKRELSTDDIFDIIAESDPVATRNMIAHALRTLLESERVTKKVRRATKSKRLAYWRAND